MQSQRWFCRQTYALNLLRAAIGNQCKLMKQRCDVRSFRLIKDNLAAAFWINCRSLMELAGRPANLYAFCVTDTHLTSKYAGTIFQP